MADVGDEFPDESIRLSLVVSYDGGAFSGFATNRGVRTVEATLSDALARYCGHSVALSCAGRTDKGVHARGQVVSFDAPARIIGDGSSRSSSSLEGLVRSVNSMCSPSIAVRDPRVAARDFDARFDAEWRRYRYTILNSPTPDPLAASTSWYVSKPLDVRAMQNAAVVIVGLHDFSSFCRRPSPFRDGSERSLKRTVHSAEWSSSPDGFLRLDLCGSAFCHQMIRSLVGTMVDVGTGRLKASDVRHILVAGDRDLASNVAPPHGLCLEQVGYADR